MIQLHNVSKYFTTPKGRKYVLRNININLPERANIGVLGLNGSGKSTLLRMIGGIDYPSAGSIEISGYISWPLGLGGGLQGGLTGKQNAQFVCRIYGDDKESIKEKLSFIELFSELGDYYEMPVKTYSSGMRSRLKFAISMAFDFDIYLFDEINAVGDAKFRAKSRAALKEKRDKANYIMVSHNANDLIKECDVLAILHEGSITLFEDIKYGIRHYRRNIAIN
jgi:capsular polysaccharide transport system ATP-binding protein